MDLHFAPPPTPLFVSLFVPSALAVITSTSTLVVFAVALSGAAAREDGGLGLDGLLARLDERLLVLRHSLLDHRK